MFKEVFWRASCCSNGRLELQWNLMSSSRRDLQQSFLEQHGEEELQKCSRFKMFSKFISIVFTVTSSTKNRKLNNSLSLSWELWCRVHVEFNFLLRNSDSVLRWSKCRLALNRVRKFPGTGTCIFCAVSTWTKTQFRCGQKNHFEMNLV